MQRRLIFLPVLALAAAAAGLALLLGGRMVTTTETRVIDRVAARYLGEAGAGAALSDCAARPAASDGLWLVVACVSGRGARFEYFVDGYGRLVHVNRTGGTS